MVACGARQPASPSAAQGKIAVAASFYPLYEFAKRVGGDRIEVSNLVAVGAEPHDLELTPRDLERLRQARLMVYIGGGFQPGLERALVALGDPDLVLLDVAQGVNLYESPESTGAKGLDPHIWLDPLLAKEIITEIKDTLIALDPDNKDTYERNAQAYAAQLDALHNEFQTGLQGCQKQEFVTSHAAFAYLARRYGLTQVPITGISPEQEPSPQRMREIVQLVRDHKIKVIYFETLVDPRVAETIAREVGAKTLVLNPIEGLTKEEAAQGKGYLDLMRQNLANLRIGLECP
ncbi:MAG: zinc ABC transporter substrate-binding protein [Chloroflexi bacterium]|nr:zinc ABC transporter substrate-binding protein [Chloroflexota bacterium]